uniref:ADIPOR-like receptor n=1 Tax=Timema genevievae TaxID=629358 RepID=A0A7R9PSC7_TIMGE|nr:unnamed protein product [Timema genevievae]
MIPTLRSTHNWGQNYLLRYYRAVRLTTHSFLVNCKLMRIAAVSSEVWTVSPFPPYDVNQCGEKMEQIVTMKAKRLKLLYVTDPRVMTHIRAVIIKLSWKCTNKVLFRCVDNKTPNNLVVAIGKLSHPRLAQVTNSLALILSCITYASHFHTSYTHASHTPFSPAVGPDMSDYEDAIESLDDATLGLRHRSLWDPDRDSLGSEIVPGLREVSQLLDDDDSSVLTEGDDGVGCPLPSTPEDEHLLDCEINEVLKAGVLSDEIDLSALAHNAAEQAEEFVRKVWEASWKVCHFRNLPQWLQDNDYLHAGHRPPLPSFYACFKSIFRIHTETGNIWTHLLGCVAFIGVATYFLSQPTMTLEEKLVFGAFFVGAIVCLGMSSAFHTVHCHSECVGKLFSKCVQ